MPTAEEGFMSKKEHGGRGRGEQPRHKGRGLAVTAWMWDVIQG